MRLRHKVILLAIAVGLVGNGISAGLSVPQEKATLENIVALEMLLVVFPGVVVLPMWDKWSQKRSGAPIQV